MQVKKILEEYRKNIERVKFLENELQFLNQHVIDINLKEPKKETSNLNDVDKVFQKNMYSKVNVEKIENEIVFLKHQIEQAEGFVLAAKNKEDSEILRKRYCLGVSCSKLAITLHLTERAISKKIQNNIAYIEEIVSMDFMRYEMNM